MLKKPICFSYREYVELREAYKALLADNQKLMADNRRLRDELDNLKSSEYVRIETYRELYEKYTKLKNVKLGFCRIAEEDK